MNDKDKRSGLNSTSVSIFAVVMGITGTLALMFINFVFIYTLQLLQTRQVAWGGYLQAILMAVINIAIVVWFGRTLAKAGWGRVFKPPVPASSSTQNPTSQRPPSKASTDEARAARARAKKALLAYSQTVTSFNIQDVMKVTGQGRVEAEYVLDDLIMADHLKAEHTEQGFIYRANSDEADTSNKH
ncbi:MAG: hypothetical protein AAF708_16200 [Deinococcota bacterium]